MFTIYRYFFLEEKMFIIYRYFFLEKKEKVFTLNSNTYYLIYNFFFLTLSKNIFGKLVWTIIIFKKKIMCEEEDFAIEYVAFFF